MESILYNISIYHFFKGFFNFHNLLLHFTLENLIKVWVKTLLVFSSKCSFSVQRFIHKHFKSWQLKNSCICCLFCKVSIIDRVTSLSTSKPCWVSAVLFNSVYQVDKISFRFRHFLSFNQNITITIIGLGPEFRIIPDGNMIIQSHSQMIFNQIFSWAPQIHWIPIEEGLSQFIELVLRNFFWGVLFTQKNIAPEIWCQIFMFNSQSSLYWAIQISLKHMSYCVKRKINSRVGQWFNQIFLIEWQLSTKPKWSRASPLFQPVNCINQIIMQNLTVTFKLGLDVI